MNDRDRNNIGEEAVALANLAIARLGWIFRHQPANDNGIDAEIEIAPVSQHGRLLKAQIKGGPSYFSKRGSPVLYGKVGELERWQTLGIPVVIITCNLERAVCYWQIVADTTIERTVRGWKLHTPCTNILNLDATEPLRQLAARSDSYLTVAKVRTMSSPAFSVPGWALGQTLEIRSGIVSDVEPVVQEASSAGSKPTKVPENVSILYTNYAGTSSRDVFTLFDEKFAAKLDDELSLIVALNEDESLWFCVGAYNWTLRKQSEFLVRAWPSLNPAEHRKQRVVAGAVSVTPVVTGFVVMHATHQQLLGIASGAVIFAILAGLSLRFVKTTDRLNKPLAKRRVQEVLDEWFRSASGLQYGD